MIISMFRFLLIGSLIAAVNVASASGFSQPTGEDIVDCGAPRGSFEVVTCSSPGVFDSVNHVHQMIVFADESKKAGLQKEISFFYEWFFSIEQHCSQEDYRVKSGCIGDIIFGPANGVAQFDTLISLLYEGESDIEGDNECDGCEETSNSSQLVLPQTSFQQESRRIQDTSGSKSKSKSASSVKSSSPLEFLEKRETKKVTGTQAAAEDWYRNFWDVVYKTHKGRIQSDDNQQGKDVDPNWQTDSVKDPLSGSSIITTTKTFAFQNSSASVSFVCDTKKKQLEFFLFDATPEILEMSIVDTARQPAELSVVFEPSPYGFEPGHIFTSRNWRTGSLKEFVGRKLTLIGFNQRGWGIGFCAGDSGIAWNMPFCRTVRANLPEELRREADRNRVSLSVYKNTENVFDYWRSFHKIKFSIQTRWADYAKQVLKPIQYYLEIYPNKEPLSYLFSECYRDENQCVPYYDRTDSNDCSKNFQKEIYR